MNLIKLSATDSTNSFLSEMSRTYSLESPTVVIADNQTSGRGQRNATWHFVPGKSLALSIYIEPKKLLAADQFFLSMLVSLSIQKVLQDFGVPKVSVKWPNDILSRSKKLVGILIENTIKQSVISSSIIGVGINVNTNLVKELPKLGSMFSQTGKNFDLDLVATKVIEDLIPKIDNLQVDDYPRIQQEYEEHLFKKDSVSSFIDESDSLFLGIIRGVTETGQLKVESSSSNSLQLYWPKEVSLQY